MTDYERGRMDERAEIVARLLSMATSWSGSMGGSALHYAARLIERGDHITKDTR